MALQETIDETGLADARGTFDHDDAGAAPLDLVERLLQRVRHAPAPDEGLLGRTRRDGAVGRTPRDLAVGVPTVRSERDARHRAPFRAAPGDVRMNVVARMCSASAEPPVRDPAVH